MTLPKATAAAALLACFVTGAAAMPAGRLTLAVANAAPESDQISSTTYLTVTDGNTTELWDGSAWTPRTYSADLSLALTSAHTASSNYDVFEYWDGSALHICTGPAWLSNVARGAGSGTTEVAVVDGRMVNANSISCRSGASTWTVPAHYGLLRGGFRTTSAGVTADSADTRFLWDLFRPRLLPVKRVDSAANWSYTSDVFRIANGLSANRIAVFNGVAGRPVDITVTAYMSSATSTILAGFVGIGIDSTTVDSGILEHPCAGGNSFPLLPCRAQFVGFPGMGYHEINWLERANSTVYTEMFTGAGPPGYQNGIIGTVLQ